MSGYGLKFESVVNSWEGGVRNTARKDLIPPSSMPYIENGEMAFVGDGTAVVRRRSAWGLRAWPSTTPISTIVSFDALADNGSFTSYLIAVGDQLLYVVDPLTYAWEHPDNITFAAVDEDDYTSIGRAFVSSATANNRVFLTRGGTVTGDDIFSGRTAIQFDGTDWLGVGLAAPLKVIGEFVPQWDATVGAAGSMTGDYDVTCTVYSSATGAESSRSGPDFVSRTLAAETIDFEITSNLVTSVDPHADFVNVYIRKPAISTTFYRIGQIPLVAGTTNFDISDDEYNALTIAAPDEFENNIIPITAYLLCWHLGRMFAADAGTVYYSKIGFPEAWDPEHFEDVFSDDGEAITALFTLNGNLIVLKENSVCAIIGDSPSNWEVRKLFSGGVGCVSKGSVVIADGLAYWWGPDGPLAWDGVSEPKRIGKAVVNEFIQKGAWNAELKGKVRGVLDVDGERIMWTFPYNYKGMKADTNTAVLPLKHRIGLFEGIWVGSKVTALASARGVDGRLRVLLGTDVGKICELGHGFADGVPLGVGIYDAVGGLASTTTISFADADFTMVGEFCTVLAQSTGEVIVHSRATGVSGTVITIEDVQDTALVGLNTHAVVVGVPVLFIDTKWVDDGSAFHKKRYEFAFVQLKALTGYDTEDTIIPKAWIRVGFDYGGRAGREITSHSNSQALTNYYEWNTALWNESFWLVDVPVDERIRVARVAKTWSVQMAFAYPWVDFHVLKVGMSGEYLTTKS